MYLKILDSVNRTPVMAPMKYGGQNLQMLLGVPLRPSSTTQGEWIWDVHFAIEQEQTRSFGKYCTK